MFSSSISIEGVVYRAGTEDGPSFQFKTGKDWSGGVWLVKTPALYYPLHLVSSHDAKANQKVFLWATDIANITKSDILTVEKDKPFEGVYQVELKGSTCPGHSQEEAQRIKNELESTSNKWKKVPVEECRGGESLMDFSPLVIAVMVYMKDHYPTTPEEFNFQAELKAASHWRWPDKDKRCLSLKSGPHNDDRLKIAAQATWQKWIAKVEAHQERYFYRESGKERISDLKERIFSLKLYSKSEGLGLNDTAPVDEKQADKKQSNQERKKGEEVKKQGGTQPMKGQISVKEMCRKIEVC